MIVETSPAASFAYSCLQVAGTALLIGGLCWTLREIDGNGRPAPATPSEAVAAASNASGSPATLAWGLTGEYDRGSDVASLETFKAACERKLKTVVSRLGPTIGDADRAGLLQHISRSVEMADPQARRLLRKFTGRETFEYGCTQPPGQPVLAVLTRAPA
jgi:hypothetical protein